MDNTDIAENTIFLNKRFIQVFNMVQRTGGFRRKTRKKLKKPLRRKGKISTTRYLQEFRQGDKVVLKAEPAIQKGMYFPRFHGKRGTIKGKKGKSYIVVIKDGKKEKELIVHPIHLLKVQHNDKTSNS